ncbi:outer membrane porin [Pseudodesulfovibrio mercurii]|uniref:Outer membrane porin n=1 Tax=Pseudodesulfovibrio mercurii TaxID=641491 RepID=F0JFE9_9BACT|nr:OprD family outer membrane porin [Pseudodesulfovibrio mercurii]EGB14873.1 outer membrane porin [Pseudodesulfovibrio mercurii]
MSVKCSHLVLACLLSLVLAQPALAAEEKTVSPYGTVTGQARLYYFTQRNKGTGQEFDVIKESLALGGWLKYETPWLEDHLGLGVALYGTAPLTGELNQPDQGGTGLLTSDNEGFAVVGEAYVKARYEKTEARIWRQRIETPFINSNDSRMLPQSFEAYGLKSGDIDNLELSVFWVDKEKKRDSDTFKSMSNVAGLTDVNRGVFMTGADWKPLANLPTRFWNYYAPDLDNTFFTQFKYTFGDPEGVEYAVLVQGVSQNSVGEQLAGSYNTGELGLMGTVKYSGFTFDLGASIVDDSVGIRNSWGVYPFFNNLMNYSFNRAGEKSLLLGVAYDFSRIGWDGYRADIKAGFGDTPDTGFNATYDRSEYDLDIYYDFDGDLKGMSLLSRFSYQDADESMGGRDGYQVRLRLQYNFQLL